MCTPLVAVAVTAASGAYKAYTQYQQSRVQENYYNYQESLVHQEQAFVSEQAKEQKDLILRTSERNINIAQTQAMEESKSLMRQSSVVKGAQRAALAAMGLSGATAADILSDTIEKSNLDQIALQYNADLKSYVYREEAKERVWAVGEEAKYKLWALGEEGRQYSFAAKNARKAGRIAVAGTLLETATTMALQGSSLFSGGSSKTPSSTFNLGSGKKSYFSFNKDYAAGLAF